ncbi:MAG: glycosyltransferase family 4 protein [Candidatus Micrarchaeales archaeon]|jgi:Glycosyltransferase|uniref:Glycosyl transferase group 1 n=1 Tax=Candidatus Micrarchaeum acidiphilum ARMAN-2 TaxID=425595 RepID=C7DHQ7_MICA2|nr:MAG: glycosyl transferase group 1 [Candidatus Micrarchaeum acidiphilum ARMAN-2]MCW6160728.1 glycosyltransferase family 4 protein [Candidatus Micrarchaeales archaeon]
MKKVLMMESGSFKTIGGAANDTFELYKYLRARGGFDVELFGDFSKFGYDGALKLEDLESKKFDVVILNSIRDVAIAERYVLHDKGIKTVYVDRGDAVTHYSKALMKRAVAKVPSVMGRLNKPEYFDSKASKLAHSSNSKLARNVRDYVSKSYNIYLLGRMKRWLTCYVAINAEQIDLAKAFFKNSATIEYIPIAPHEKFKKLEIDRDFSGALHVGRLEETQKNVSFLIKGIKKVTDAHSELRGKEILRIIGEGPDEAYYKNLTDSLGLSRCISFSGFKSEGALVNAYNNCGFFVSCSRWESFSRVFIEAMACGTPVLANTNNDKIISYNPKKYVVMDGETGLVYRFGDIGDFSEKFYRLYSDRRLRESLARNAYSYATKEFSIEKTYGRYYEIVSRL